jgi:hypothetical protein
VLAEKQSLTMTGHSFSRGVGEAASASALALAGRIDAIADEAQTQVAAQLSISVLALWDERQFPAPTSNDVEDQSKRAQ